jgi:hypothetical protein
MVSRKDRSTCTLIPFKRRLYCAKKRRDEGCKNLGFINKRCPNLLYTKEDVMDEARRGTREIVSWSGYTSNAIEYAERFRPSLRLKHRDEIVKSRRRRQKVVLTAV